MGMTLDVIQKMSVEEKVDFLLQTENKVLIRKFCGISQSKLLMLELSHQNALKKFLKSRIENMSELHFQQKIGELLK